MKPYYSDEWVTLYHGDCRDVLPFVRLEAGDALITDPPYGIAYDSGHYGTLPRSIRGDKNTDARDWAVAYWRSYNRVDWPGLVFGTWRVPPPDGTRQVLVWDTGGALGMGALDLPWKPAHQEVYVIGRGFVGDRGTDVLRFPPVQSMAKNGRVHPHEKPLSLMGYLVGCTTVGTRIIDPFAGSGSTLRAAKDRGRYAVGIEIEERYCEIAAKRLSQEVLDLTFGDREVRSP